MRRQFDVIDEMDELELEAAEEDEDDLEDVDDVDMKTDEVINDDDDFLFVCFRGWTINLNI